MTYAMNQIKYRAKNLLFPVKKRLIKKFGRNLIPLYFWLVSLTFYRTFYIFNVDFFLPGILFLRFVEFLLMGWLIFEFPADYVHSYLHFFSALFLHFSSNLCNNPFDFHNLLHTAL